jgi:hypothetical protein
MVRHGKTVYWTSKQTNFVPWQFLDIRRKASSTACHVLSTWDCKCRAESWLYSPLTRRSWIVVGCCRCDLHAGIPLTPLTGSKQVRSLASWCILLQQGKGLQPLILTHTHKLHLAANPRKKLSWSQLGLREISTRCLDSYCMLLLLPLLFTVFFIFVYFLHAHFVVLVWIPESFLAILGNPVFIKTCASCFPPSHGTAVL